MVGGIGFIVYKKVILPRKNNDGYIRQSTEPALHWYWEKCDKDNNANVYW